jgi:hypothetical protein
VNGAINGVTGNQRYAIDATRYSPQIQLNAENGSIMFLTDDKYGPEVDTTNHLWRDMTAQPVMSINANKAVHLEPQATSPSNPALGDLYVNTNGKLYFYNGSAWRAVMFEP